MVRCGEECTLPRPFSVCNTEGDNLEILYTVWADGRGTPWLAKRGTGDTVSIFGPLGNGFTIGQTAKNILLVAGGMGIAPLYFLAKEAVARHLAVTFLYGTSSKDRYPLPAEFNPVPATEDGAVGYKGMITDLIPQYVDIADQVFACGPIAMYQTLTRKRDELKITGKPVQASLEVKMGCGTGACYGCTIRTEQGLKQVCKDGPVFDLEDVDWNSLG
jgi:dihydroorotate dehydrogenase electron transfer subunit